MIRLVTQYMMQVSKRKSMACTTILAILIMGAGQIYLGRVKRGLAIFLLATAVSITLSGLSGAVMPQGESGPLTGGSPLLGTTLVLAVFIIGLFAWQVADARQICRVYNSELA